MDIRALIKETPRNSDISVTDVVSVLNYVFSQLVMVSVKEPIECGDWLIEKIDDKSFCLTERYTDSDMARFLHDEFTKKKLLKVIDKL